MKYSVVWIPDAETQLTRIWLESRDHQAIAEACEQIEQSLATKPLNAGESRFEDRRIVFADPLAVTFSVSQVDRLVRVLSVSRTSLRRGH